MTLTTDQREALRQKVMAEMSRRMPIISKRLNEWRDWPGTWAFADVAVAALQDELARVNALLERAEKAEKALAETDWAAAVDNAAGGVKASAEAERYASLPAVIVGGEVVPDGVNPSDGAQRG